MAADEARRQAAQMFQDRPEELFGHRRRAHLVGVGEGVALGRGGPAQAGERARVQTQRVVHIVESDAVSELSIHQGDQMTPGTEAAGFVLNLSGARQLGRQELRNEVANLPQEVQF